MKKDRSHQFYLRMEQLVGPSEASLLIESLSNFSPKSVRFNRTAFDFDPGCINECAETTVIGGMLETAGPAVPWCTPFGRYWKKEILPSQTLEYAAGKYYIQEASAMLAISAASHVIDFSGKTVLDISAAPGGKATQAAELIAQNIRGQGEGSRSSKGYLVANEVVPKRVDALVWNVIRHRLNNVIVTSLPTDTLSQALPQFFDIVVVDAPCSGEGLFQKRKQSLDDWSEKNVRFCAKRQNTILGDAVRLLRPGGYIVYSTCTFAKEENEDQVEYMFNLGMNPVSWPKEISVSPAISDNERVQLCSRRIFPHREGGAGAFVAILQKEDFVPDVVEPEYECFKCTEIQFKALEKQRQPLIHAKTMSGFFFEKNGILSYFSNERIPSVLFRRSFQVGAPILDKHRHEAWMYGSVQLAHPESVIDIPQEDAYSYIKGNNIRIDKPDGFYFVRAQTEDTNSPGNVERNILGLVKVTNNSGLNLYPNPLRCR